MNVSTESPVRKHVPIRTCIGCRAQQKRANLIRLSRKPGQNGVTIDSDATNPGRGAWIHPQMSCLTKAQKTGAIYRALRIKAPPGFDELDLTNVDVFIANQA